VAALRESAGRAPESPSSIAATLRPLAERARDAEAADNRAIVEHGGDSPTAVGRWGDCQNAYQSLHAACSPERVLALCEAVERTTAIDAGVVLCRVFDDVDEALAEWEVFDKARWLSEARALGAFIRRRLRSGAPHV
jgi:hypothetical protein